MRTARHGDKEHEPESLIPDLAAASARYGIQCLCRCGALVTMIRSSQRCRHWIRTPSRLSFPSAHASSTTAAAVLMAPLTGLPLPVLLVPPMALSRLVLGVHYPSDVVTGVAVGALVAQLVKKIGSPR